MTHCNLIQIDLFPAKNLHGFLGVWPSQKKREVLVLGIFADPLGHAVAPSWTPSSCWPVWPSLQAIGLAASALHHPCTNFSSKLLMPCNPNLPSPTLLLSGLGPPSSACLAAETVLHGGPIKNITVPVLPESASSSNRPIRWSLTMSPLCTPHRSSHHETSRGEEWPSQRVSPFSSSCG